MAGKRDPEDHRNELYKSLLRIADAVRPPFVVVENVPGLLSERNRIPFSRIIKGLKRLEYDVEYRIYDAANFGAAQHRRRVFIVASSVIPARNVFDNITFNGGIKTVRDAFVGLPSKREIKKINHTFMEHGSNVKKRISKIRGLGLISYRRLNKNKPSVAIISGHNALPVHPTEHRAISIREAARLQGIPDDFIFEGPRTHQTVQVANAVPYQMAFGTARAIRSAKASNIPSRGRLFNRLSHKSSEKLLRVMREGFCSFYKKQGRSYPWRQTKDPHQILLTELLLQRTKSETVSREWKEIVNSSILTGEGYKISTRKLNGVVKRLGIFSRTTSIKLVFSKLFQYHKTRVPMNYDELMNLPGIGSYIAAAVRTFAFNIPDFPVDSNAFRFIQRYFGVNIRGKKSEARQIREFMNKIINPKNPKQFVYGFLDFCSIVCKPSNPSCSGCFLKKPCVHGRGLHVPSLHQKP